MCGDISVLNLTMANIFNARVKVVDGNVAYSDQVQSVSKKLLGGRNNLHGGVR